MPCHAPPGAPPPPPTTPTPTQALQWLRHGCLPVIVVEGEPPEEKRAEQQVRCGHLTSCAVWSLDELRTWTTVVGQACHTCSLRCPLRVGC